jgi:predicted transcriptional regulator
MAQTLLELTASIVAAHASINEMTGEELLLEIQKIHASLQKLEAGEPAVEAAPEKKGPAVSLRKAFQPDQVSCMICGKSGMKTLTRHLSQVHGMKPREYRKQFGIPTSQSLTAKNFSEARRKMANERGLADNLAKARAARAAKTAKKTETAPKTSTKAKTTKAKKTAA